MAYFKKRLKKKNEENRFRKVMLVYKRWTVGSLYTHTLNHSKLFSEHVDMNKLKI